MVDHQHELQFGVAPPPLLIRLSFTPGSHVTISVFRNLSMSSVALVCMPVVSVERPSLALGLLKPILEQGGISTSIFNAHLHYLEWIGARDYTFLNRRSASSVCGEWVFAEAAFGTAGSVTDFAALLRRFELSLAPDENAELEAILTRLRATAVDFVNWVADQVLAEQPMIVGCTSTFQQQVPSLALLRRIRTLAPHVVSVMGGANMETVMGHAAHSRFHWLDVAVSGEAEDTVLPLFQALLEHGADIPAELAPHGVMVPAHRTQGYPIDPKSGDLPRHSVASMQGLPGPDFDSYFRDLQNSPLRSAIQPTIPIELSRGCWWGERSHCTFCGLNGGAMTYRARNPVEAEALFAEVAQRYATRRFEVVDNILAMDYFDTLLKSETFLARKYGIFFETKSNLKEHHIAKLATAGINAIQPGIESLHSEILKLMKKGVTAMVNVRLLRLCAEYQIYVAWAFITDFPAERDECYTEMAAMIPRMTHIRPGSMVSLRYDRFSPYFRDAVSHGLDLEPSPFYNEIYPCTPDEVVEHAYFFTRRGESSGGMSVISKPRPDRPGLETFRLAMMDWALLWKHRGGATLSVTATDGGAVIHDTRPAFGGEHVLNAQEAALLELLRDGVSQKPGTQAYATIGDAAMVAGALERLDRLGLVLSVDGHWLSLACKPNPVPRERISPFGQFRPPEPAVPFLAQTAAE